MTASPVPLLILVQCSRAMIRDIPSSLGEYPADFVARYALDHLLDGLVQVHADSPLSLDVAVLGYHADDAGVHFSSLLGAADAVWQPLAELALFEPAPRHEGHPRRWLGSTENQGDAAPGAALAYAHRLLLRRLIQGQLQQPPVLVHVCSEEGWTPRAIALIRSIEALSVAGQPLPVIHVLLHPTRDDPGENHQILPDRLIRNDVPTAVIWPHLFPETLEDFPAEDLPAVTLSTQLFTLHKLGNEPKNYEDASAQEGFRLAVADGAGEGIFSRQWAELLASTWVQSGVQLTDPAAYSAWLAQARQELLNRIDYPNLRWSQQKKFDDVGAAATLITLTLQADTAGRLGWRSAAIGDACLFWIRGADWLCFPAADEGQLTSAPALLRSRSDTRIPEPLFACGSFAVGDLFFLATDAVAGYLLSQARTGFDWQRYVTLRHEEWQQEIAEARASGAIVNDDCTLLIVQVSPMRTSDEARPAHEAGEMTRDS